MTTPVTILTGFLGAGKTTLLRHLLRHIDAHRVVVVENEFGAANIDSELLEEISPGMVRRVNGCICCAVEVDLRHTFRSLIEARKRGHIDFDRVILETTGMADAAGVAETFSRRDEIAEAFRLDAIVTVVDARHGIVDLRNSPVAQTQVALADVLVVSKADLVDAEAMAAVSARLAEANPTATRIEALHGAVEPAQVLDVDAFGRFRLRRLVRVGGHAHDPFGSVVLEDDGPHDLRRLGAWLRRLSRERPYDLYRYKGVIRAGGGRRVVLQGVHDLFSLQTARRWRADETPRTTLVMIGVDLDPTELQAALEAARLRR
ncbi:MAG: GTP-binding protein [Myxococcales bacterium]|nr:GTP-binding protein [Myxococcales bacterium]